MFKFFILLLLSYLALACNSINNNHESRSGRKRRQVAETNEMNEGQFHYDLLCPEDQTQSFCKSGQGETIIMR